MIYGYVRGTVLLVIIMLNVIDRLIGGRTEEIWGFCGWDPGDQMPAAGGSILSHSERPIFPVLMLR